MRGLTSNPTIFEKAIVASSDYEEALRKLAAEGKSTADIYEALVIEDIRGACDLLLPVYQESDAVDGRVSLEVLPELATNTEKTVSGGLAPRQAGRAPQRHDQGAGHAGGDPGHPRADGARGERQRDADLLAPAVRGGRGGVSGGARGPQGGGRRLRRASPRWPASSSRASTPCATSCSTRRRRPRRPRRRAARCCAARSGSPTPRWPTRSTSGPSPRRAGRRWPATGAHPQRLLWASTGTKDPSYPDTYYVDALMGRDTVDTVPPATLDAFLDHGDPAARLETDLEGAQGGRRRARRAGDRPRPGLPRPARRRREVVHHFDDRADRRHRRPPRRAARVDLRAPEGGAARGAAAGDRRRDRAAGGREGARSGSGRAIRRSSPRIRRTKSRSRAGSAGCACRPPCLRRRSSASWRRSPPRWRAPASPTRSCSAWAAARSAPRSWGSTWPSQPGGLKLHVLDNTDPAAVAEVDRAIAGKKALFLVASKSGGTIEIQSFERHFWQKTLARERRRRRPRRARAFVAITDPATRLGQLAEEKKYRRTFINPADIGGRYSALSYFGLVPAALLRAPLAGIAGGGHHLRRGLEPGRPGRGEPGRASRGGAWAPPARPDATS